MKIINKTNMEDEKITISENQKKCLEVLVNTHEEDDYCFFFKYISEQTGIPKDKVRIYVRALARKGLAKYHVGLQDHDGMIAGSGYAATYDGKRLTRGYCKKGNCTGMPEHESEYCWHCEYKKREEN